MAGLLVASSVAKLASPSSTRAALATFGIVGELRQRVVWTLLVAGELVLAAGVAAGSPPAAYPAAGPMAGVRRAPPPAPPPRPARAARPRLRARAPRGPPPAGRH